MPTALVDVLAVVSLVVLLVVAFVHPPAWVEVLVGLLAAGAVLLSGAVDWSGAVEQTELLFPVVASLFQKLTGNRPVAA